MSKALWQFGAIELMRLYRERSLAPQAVVKAILARMETVNPRLHAVVSRRDTAVLAEAEASAQRFAQGRPLSDLDGIPLTVKDSLFTVDMPTTCGTAAMRDYQPGHDELVVARARAGGALIVGKTNVPEFANDGYTANPLFGATGNPWNPTLTPGGSSGGAVAAVAAGIAPLAIAQDGGGSIRRPASHTGLVGLKPSLSAWPREHTLPGLLLDFDCIGPVARTVADVRLLFDALRGPAAADRSSLAAAYAAGQPRPQAPLRVLYVEHLYDNPLDPQIADRCRRAVHKLETLGHSVEHGSLPLDVGFRAGGLAAHWPGGPGPRCSSSIPTGRRAPAPSTAMRPRSAGAFLPRASGRSASVCGACAASASPVFERFDVIVMPAAAALPWPANEPYPDADRRA